METPRHILSRCREQLSTYYRQAADLRLSGKIADALVIEARAERLIDSYSELEDEAAGIQADAALEGGR